MNQAHGYALDFLKYYADRGVAIETLCEFSRASVVGMLYTVQIGGEVYFQGKHHRILAQQLVVKEMAGQPCLEVFEVAALYAELGVLPPEKIVQVSLWGNE